MKFVDFKNRIKCKDYVYSSMVDQALSKCEVLDLIQIPSKNKAKSNAGHNVQNIVNLN